MQFQVWYRHYISSIKMIFVFFLVVYFWTQAKVLLKSWVKTLSTHYVSPRQVHKAFRISWPMRKSCSQAGWRCGRESWCPHLEPTFSFFFSFTLLNDLRHEKKPQNLVFEVNHAPYCTSRAHCVTSLSSAHTHVLTEGLRQGHKTHTPFLFCVPFCALADCQTQIANLANFIHIFLLLLFGRYNQKSILGTGFHLKLFI
jgi:hypothetical protein